MRDSQARGARIIPGIPAAIVVALLFSGLPAAGQDHQHPEGDFSQLGRVEFPTSCAPAAAAEFERAVAALHSFWFETADAAFRRVAEADPSCAMAHWGRAMTMMGNPMTRAAPPERLFEQGRAAAQRAQELAGNATERERMYIAAAAAFYGAGPGHLDRMLALEGAFEALHRAYPEDREATVFYGRALVANGDPGDREFERQLRAADLMEPLFAAHTQHPGLAHYLIHAYDAPPLAERGLKAARAYAAIAPDAPHALHMPSHIFTRLGHWDESIETNTRAAQAEPNPDAAVHPMDYKVYAFLQQGRDADAKSVVDRAVQNPDAFYGGQLGYNFAAMPARYALEREAWQEAAALKVPGSAPAHVEAVTRFARAIGAARSGAAAQATQEIARLEELTKKLDENREREWAIRVDAQRLAAAAWAAYASGDTKTALELGAAAVELDEMIEKHPVTPGPILPARELLADMLMDLGRHADARVQYEQTLQREPRRARALFGAARAAELAGDAATAGVHYGALLELMSNADPARPQVQAARRFTQGRR
jgi:tetratricopeptide (TPR) repeat protein